MVICSLVVSTNTAENPLGIQIYDDQTLLVDTLVDSVTKTITFSIDDTQLPDMVDSNLRIKLHGKNDSHTRGPSEDHGHVIIKDLIIDDVVLINDEHATQTQLYNTMTYEYDTTTDSYTTFMGRNGIVNMPFKKPIHFWLATDILPWIHIAY